MTTMTTTEKLLRARMNQIAHARGAKAQARAGSVCGRNYWPKPGAKGGTAMTNPTPEQRAQEIMISAAYDGTWLQDELLPLIAAAIRSAEQAQAERDARLCLEIGALGAGRAISADHYAAAIREDAANEFRNPVP